MKKIVWYQIVRFKDKNGEWYIAGRFSNFSKAYVFASGRGREYVIEPQCEVKDE